MSRTLCARVFALLCSGWVAPASAYDWQWPLELGDADATLHRLPLDAEVYAQIRDPGLGDLEVCDANGVLVPSVLVQATADSTATSHWERVVAFPLPDSVTQDPGALQALITRSVGDEQLRVEVRGGAASDEPGSQQWLIDLGSTSSSADKARLELVDLAANTWTARLSVAQSRDLQAWHSAAKATQLYRVQHEGHQLEALEIDLAGNTSRYLRVQMDQASAPASVSFGVRRSQRTTVPGETHEITLSAARQEQGGWTFQLPGMLRVEAWALDWGDQTWLAEATLSSRFSERAGWQLRDRADSYRLRIADAWRSPSWRAFPAARQPHWQLVLKPAPSVPPRLRLRLTRDYVDFVPSGTPPYRLVAGSDRQRRVDAPQRVRALAGTRQGTVRLGAKQPAADDVREVVIEPPKDFTRWLLWGALVVGALLVLGMVRQVMREQRPG